MIIAVEQPDAVAVVIIAIIILMTTIVVDVAGWIWDITIHAITTMVVPAEHRQVDDPSRVVDKIVRRASVEPDPNLVVRHHHNEVHHVALYPHVEAAEEVVDGYQKRRIK